MTAVPVGPWLTLPQAAERAKAGVRTLSRALADETLRGHQAVKGGKWRIHVEDLDAWVRGEKADVQIAKITRRSA